MEIIQLEREDVPEICLVGLWMRPGLIIDDILISKWAYKTCSHLPDDDYLMIFSTCLVLLKFYRRNSILEKYSFYHILYISLLCYLSLQVESGQTFDI